MPANETTARDRTLVEEHGGWQNVSVFGATVRVGTVDLPAIDTTWYALSVRNSETDDDGALVWLSYAERERLIVALGGTV